MSEFTFDGRIHHPDIEHVDFFGPEQVDRATKLYLIPRYNSIPVMTHRTNLLVHSVRVTGHAQLLSNILIARGVYVDEPKLFYMADRHDDAEIVTGDIPTPVKRSATPEQKAEMKKAEKEAASQVGPMIEGPRSVPDFFPSIYDEYEERKSLEARIANFADKWDGFEEAEHEVVCGENRAKFEEVALAYHADLERLVVANQDWMPDVVAVLGDAFTTWVDPITFLAKTPENLDYTNIGTFYKSLSEGTSSSYKWWLRFNMDHFSGSLDFLSNTFPGWIERFPEEVLDDIDRVKMGLPRLNNAGLWLPPDYRTDPDNPTFGESLRSNLLLPTLMALACVF